MGMRNTGTTVEYMWYGQIKRGRVWESHTGVRCIRMGGTVRPSQRYLKLVTYRGRWGRRHGASVFTDWGKAYTPPQDSQQRRRARSRAQLREKTIAKLRSHFTKAELRSLYERIDGGYRFAVSKADLGI